MCENRSMSVVMSLQLVSVIDLQAYMEKFFSCLWTAFPSVNEDFFHLKTEFTVNVARPVENGFCLR